MNNRLGLTKIVSGGQTGVDRGALDAAIACNVPHGGWCPRDRLAEDGTIAECYQLSEHESRDYALRTEQNVIDSDGTLILYFPPLTGGTLLTHQKAKRWRKPLLRIRLDRPVNYERIVAWIAEHELRILNVAGPRGSSHPGLQDLTYQVMVHLLQHPGVLPLS
jgi:hypothetical protein